MRHDPRPDRAVPSEQLASHETRDQTGGEDNVDAVEKREDQSAAADANQRAVTEEHGGEEASEQELLADGRRRSKEESRRDYRPDAAGGCATKTPWGVCSSPVNRV